MRQLPAAFQEILEEEKIGYERSYQKSREIQEKYNNTMTLYYTAICKALEPYDGVKINGQCISISYNPQKSMVLLNTDNTLRMTFNPVINHSYCACENVCDHESSTWWTLKVTLWNARGPLICYFDCGLDELNNKKKFARALKEKHLVEKFMSKNWMLEIVAEPVIPVWKNLSNCDTNGAELQRAIIKGFSTEGDPIFTKEHKEFLFKKTFTFKEHGEFFRGALTMASIRYAGDFYELLKRYETINVTIEKFLVDGD